MYSFLEILRQCKKTEVRSEERPVVGWTCTYLPLEILEAAGLEPRRILPGPSVEKADAYLDPNYCSLIKAYLGSAISGEFSSLSGIIMVNTCDGIRRLYDAWRFYCSPAFLSLLDLPRILNPSSLEYFRERVQIMIRHIEDHFHVRVTEDRLMKAIEDANSTRLLMGRLADLQGKGNPRLTHSRILDILAERWRGPRKVYHEALETFCTRLEREEYTSSFGPRLMLTGSPLCGSSLVRMVEEMGGEVVASDICTGARFLDYIAVSPDPLSSLSAAYLEKIPCARMHDTERRIAHIRRECDRTGAQGIIHFSLKFCDPYLYEAPILEETFRKMSIPVLFIEGEYTGKASGGSRTRIQAFLEMLDRNES